MSNVLRIKRRASGQAGAPGSLENAELAYNEVDDILYYGKGTGGSGGTATSVEAIAGAGVMVKLTGNQTVGGVKTFTSTIVGSVNGNAGTATKLATARAIALSGDATGSQNFDGSGNISIALTLAESGVEAGTYTKVTVDAKGRATAGATAKISELDPPSANVDFNSKKITGLAAPTANADAATKQYVDSVAQGLDAKASVLTATTANIDLVDEQTVNGVSVTAGDRVLVKNQSDATENGIYIVVAGGNWTRSPDADTWDKLVNAFCFVEQGTTSADTSWVCTINRGGSIGGGPITWVQFGAASSYQAGNGLQLSGNTFSVKLNGATLAVAAAGLKIADTYAGQASITTLGTITTGTWNGTEIGVAYGGLGLTGALTGLVLGDGSAYAAAVAGTDYLAPDSVIDCGTF